MRKLFISYSIDDRPVVDNLIRHLQQLGCSAGFDPVRGGGPDWWRDNTAAIGQSDGVVALMSPAAMNSQTCQLEIRWAQQLGKPIIFLTTGLEKSSLPNWLADGRSIDYSRPDRAETELRRVLAALPAAVPVATQVPTPPRPPLPYLTDLGAMTAQPTPLDHEQQHHLLTQLEVALRSADPEERRGGRELLEQLASRRDVYADVDRELQRLRGPGATPSQTTRTFDAIPSAPTPQASWPSKALGVLWKSALATGVCGALLVVVILGWPSQTIAALAGLVGLGLLNSAVVQGLFTISLRQLGDIGAAQFANIGATLLLLVAAALAALRLPFAEEPLLSIAIAFALGCAARGVSVTATARTAQQLPARRLYLGMGIALIAASITILLVPVDSTVPRDEAALAVATAFWFLVIGALEISAAVIIRKSCRS